VSRGKSSKYRSVDGVILFDKPTGMTSNQALQKVRRLFRARKAGHTGSLDPLATGLLPLCLGEATKISSYLLEADKHYLTTCKLGEVTDSGDQTGTVIETHSVPALDSDKIETVLASFRGDIQQIPPMYSALHHQGERLYKLARRGEQVEREPRSVRISSLQLMEFSSDSLTLKVACSKGTYIRSLVEDVGKALGCGAHVSSLRRTAVEPLIEPEMRTLEQLELLAEEGDTALFSCLIPMDQAIAHWPDVRLNADQTQSILYGQALSWQGEDLDKLRLYGDNGRFIGLGRIESGRLLPKRLINTEGQL